MVCIRTDPIQKTRRNNMTRHGVARKLQTIIQHAITNLKRIQVSVLLLCRSIQSFHGPRDFPAMPHFQGASKHCCLPAQLGAEHSTGHPNLQLRTSRALHQVAPFHFHRCSLRRHWSTMRCHPTQEYGNLHTVELALSHFFFS